MAAISKAQRLALERLGRVVPRAYYLAGGVGVAALLGHRRSLDLDLFGPTDPRPITRRLGPESGISITDRAPGTLHLDVAGVPVSLLEYRYRLLAPASRVEGVALPVASFLDLAAMKLSAIADRGAARDFWDLHAIIEATGKPLPDYLAAFGRKYPNVDVGHVVRGLVYFADAEADPLPRGLRRRRWAQLRADFEGWVRDLR